MDNQNNLKLSIDFRKWLLKILSYWWLFLLCLSASYGLGYFYYEFSTPLYSTQAKVMIKGVGGGSLTTSSILSEGLGLESGGQDLGNIIEVFRSRPIVTRAVEAMDGNVAYHKVGDFKDQPLDSGLPLTLQEYELSETLKRFTFFVRINSDNRFEFTEDPEEQGETYSFGDVIINKNGRFKLSIADYPKVVEGEVFKVSVLPVANMVRYFQRSIETEIVGRASSNILRFSMMDPLPKRTEAFISALIEAYNFAEIDDNVEVMKSTLSFVEERITSIKVELDSIESDIEQFKSDNNIITETATGSLGFALDEVRSGTAALTNYEVESQLLVSLQEFLEKNEYELIPTNFLGIAPTLTTYIGQYNNYIIQRQNLRLTVSDLSPSVKQLDRQLFDFKELILESIINLRKDLEIPINQTTKQVEEAQRNLKLIPYVEKQLLEKLRMQSTKEALYLYLLRKKEETELSLAVASANTRVLEEAQSSGGPVFPRKRMTRMGSLILGLIIPTFFIFIREFLNDKIESEDEVKGLTSIPVLGRIPNYRKQSATLLKLDERSVRAEMFRLIRTNLNFINRKKEKQILAVTSSNAGEGKSITAINLGLVIAFSGKKVLVIDLDLRRPKIAEYLGLDNSKGVTNYLMDPQSLDSFTQKAGDNGELSVMSSGPIPPNPAEMMMSDEMNDLLKSARSSFDVVIIDCPPIGVVADALLLRDHIDHFIHLVRHKKTTRRNLRELEEQYKNGELVSPQIIINDISQSMSGGSYGGYSSNKVKGYYMSN